ncbi:MAG: transcription antitermination factor NusB [Flavobacteriales bacterium CG_4_9_14_0_2_um_filter_35_242]|nr:transcription antitermination factor NusB [Zetaproteobacteria bacterium]OIO09493.1 MAG: transcription antitermination factor NusB [Flavobacteriaceae bacterium CG1_02_35_72]PIR13054.1 MAG: transcription antitermination factor NusB [Flavobacteriales bacterium CG11_big_fil_rev_8_21_14_0_20_35_7]PJA05862.1 MAG: transcription antitermination factor NusB [Flavobacteriales bacterium CG_4_10_14_0_2_um_filter_35_18]PJC58478.1 MAG: transcription antitermination factor NusB [Flavobacteriales bacterium 
MINRRHIRIKVMQSVYALLQSGNQDLKSEEKFLTNNINKLQELYILMLNLLVEIKNDATRIIKVSKKKHLATSTELNPSDKFIKNRIFIEIENNQSYLQFISDHKLKLWKENEEYVHLLRKAIEESDLYIDYMHSKADSLKEDAEFIEAIYSKIIATNDKLYSFLEDFHIGWVDDIPVVNTLLLKTVTELGKSKIFKVDNLFKDADDEAFVLDLFRKVVLNHQNFDKDIDLKTPNWDSDRIADLDLIIIKMALTEFMYFPSIPTKVSINEYLEIAKDYSTDKSSVFINGVLDKLLKDFATQNKIAKIGRGLL